jgi:hypothetical protein
MNDHDREKLAALLKSALPPMRDRALPGDLWPKMLRRLDRRPVRFAWFDFALAGMAAAGFIAFPSMIPWILFQF